MKSLKGHLLVASPSLVTPFFTRTVILMLEHGEGGALGVVLNRPTEATVADIAEQVIGDRLEWDKPISLGGPVSGPLMAIHAIEELADQEVVAGVFSTVEAGKVRQIIRDKAEPCLIVANYAGWGPSQLEGEMELDSWLTLPATAQHVFWEEDEDLWGAVVREIEGADIARLLNLKEVPPDPTLN